MQARGGIGDEPLVTQSAVQVLVCKRSVAVCDGYSWLSADIRTQVFRSLPPMYGQQNAALDALRNVLSEGADYARQITEHQVFYLAPFEATPPQIERRPPEPVPPRLPAVPELYPEPKLDDFVADLSEWDRILFWRRAKLRTAQQRFSDAHNDWYHENKSRIALIDAHAKSVEEFEEERSLWAERNEGMLARLRTAQEAHERAFERLHQSYSSDLQYLTKLRSANDAGQLSLVVEHVLRRSPYPSSFPRKAVCRLAPERGVLLVDLDLPNALVEVERAEATAKPKLNKTQRTQLVQELPIAVLIRTLQEASRADFNRRAQTICVNGWLTWHDPATGQLRREVIASAQTTTEQALALELRNIRATDCYRSLKGVVTAGLVSGDFEPVIPFLKIEEDDRVVEAREIIDTLAPRSNLASMPWEDFEHLIRELFAKEFASTGAVVNVTRASRDWGVDALIQDPDPIRGGKFVVQAKRYTNVVGVDAVRDLFGTAMNEGANRGILVTTSHFGPQSYEFAKGKPLTLIDGNGLLALLQKHGYTYRIGD